MTPELEREYFAFVNTLGVERSKVTGDTDPHTDQMSFILLHMVTGMCTEAGEVVELIRDHTHHGNPLNVTKLKDELGDLFFYLCGALVDMGSSLDEIIEMVRSSYPLLRVGVRDGGCWQAKESAYQIQTPKMTTRLLDAAMGLVIGSACMVDLLKKHMAYHRHLDPVLVKLRIGETMARLVDAAYELQSNIDELVAMNMAKLKKRYPNGYTHQNANNRDRKAEDTAQQQAMVTNVDGNRVVKGSEEDDRYGPNAFTK